MKYANLIEAETKTGLVFKSATDGANLIAEARNFEGDVVANAYKSFDSDLTPCIIVRFAQVSEYSQIFGKKY